MSIYRKYTGETPVGGDAHVDIPLSNLAVEAFSTGEEEFIADALFPDVAVGKQSDKYYVIDKDRFLALPTAGALRAPKTVARKVQFEVSSNSYFAHDYRLGNENALEDLANADMAIRLRENSVRVVVSELRRAQESRIANLVTSASNLGSGVLLTGTAKWNDFVNSSPLSAINTGHAFIRSQTGLLANTAVIDWDTMQVVRRHPELLDLYKYTSGGELAMQQLMDVFKVQRLLVGRGIQQNALPGGTSSMTNIWGNNVLLAHVETQTGLQTKTLGLRFSWRPEGFPLPFSVERQVFAGAGQPKVEVVETGHFQDEKLVAPDLGYLIGTTL